MIKECHLYCMRRILRTLKVIPAQVKCKHVMVEEYRVVRALELQKALRMLRAQKRSHTQWKSALQFQNDERECFLVTFIFSEAREVFSSSDDFSR